jgi:[ribosomal protein S5]-alanine N-acetyltransferase
LIQIEQREPEWFLGGTFGPEAGASGLAVMLVGLLLIVLWKRMNITVKKEMLNGNNLRLETERLILRSMRESDIDALHLIFVDPKVMVSFGVELFTREQMQRWLQRNLDHQNEFGYGLFSVILKETGGLIGDCGLEQIEIERSTELGYDFRSDVWNQGYATEAAFAVRDYAFNVLHLPQLISFIRVGNLASKRVAEKLGMTLAGEFTRYGIQYWKFSLTNKHVKILP